MPTLPWDLLQTEAPQPSLSTHQTRTVLLSVELSICTNSVQALFGLLGPTLSPNFRTAGVSILSPGLGLVNTSHICRGTSVELCPEFLFHPCPQEVICECDLLTALSPSAVSVDTLCVSRCSIHWAWNAVRP